MLGPGIVAKILGRVGRHTANKDEVLNLRETEDEGTWRGLGKTGEKKIIIM